MAPNYLEDIPSLTPKFDCAKISAVLADILARPARGAVVLGLHAPWGGGKTTLLNAVRETLKARENLRRPPSAPSTPQESDVYIDFNAWKFQEREALWRALILHVLEQLKASGADEKKIRELQESLYHAFTVKEKGPWKVDWRGVILEVISLALSIVKLDFVADAVRKSSGFIGRLFLGDGKKKDGKDSKDSGDSAVIDDKRIEKMASFLQRETVERQVVQIESIEQFLDEFRALVNQLRASADGKANRRIFVFIDDLDRCLPEDALTIFESIKLFLDANGCCYVVALDRDVIRKGLDMRYSRQGDAAASQDFINPDEYIEKTISISFDLPLLSADDMSVLIGDFSLTQALSFADRDLIINGLGTNPRRIIRFMNALKLQMQLAADADTAATLNLANSDRFRLFLKLQIINYRYPALFSRVLDDPELLYRLYQLANQYRNTKDKTAARKARLEGLEDEPKAARALALDEEFWRLMLLPPPIPQDLDQIRQLTGWFRYRPPTPTPSEPTR
jgi:hypothetical protein